MKIKNILILAGGDGDRFWPLTHKNLVPFNGTPFIKHLVEMVRPYADELHIVGSNDNIEQIRSVLGTTVTYHLQNLSLQGMGGAVVSCKGQINGPVMILNACDIFSPQLFESIDFSKIGENGFVFSAKKMDAYFPGGYVKLDGKKVIEIIEKPDPDKTPSSYVRLVTDCFPDFTEWVAVLETIHTEKDDWYETGLNKLIKQGNVSCNLYEGEWFALKYSWNVLSMNAFFLKRISQSFIAKTAIVSKTAAILGPVIIEDNVKIGDYVKIAGPVYIGKNSIVGDYSLIRETTIGSNSLIGSSCEVARSYLSEKTMLHRNYVGDSVLGKEVLCGAGAVTANFRFDQKKIKSLVKEKVIDTNLGKFGAIIGDKVKIGVNSTLFPGVKIGRESLILPGEKVMRDVPDATIYKS